MNKKFLRIFSVCAVLFVLTAALSSCGKSNDEVKKESGEAFSAVIDAFKSGDAQQIKSYCLSPEALGEDTEIKSAVLSSLGNITYEIKEITVNDSKNVTVNADITMIDSSKVMEKYIENIVALVSSAEYQSKLSSMERDEYQKLMNDEFEKILNGGEIPTVTKNLDVNLRFDDGKWKLAGSELTDVLVTNTVNAVSQIRQ